MYRNKLMTAALATVLTAGTVFTGVSIAGAKEPHQRPHHGQMGMGGPRGEAWRDIAFVRMLKQFDTNKDGKISKEEGTAGVEQIFEAVDANHDGSITPGELRAYRQDEMKKIREGRKDMADKSAQANDDQPSNDNADAAGQMKPDGRHGGRHKGGGMKRGMMLAALMRQVDTDENGQISKQEAAAAFDKFFTRMDTNKDGLVSVDDLPNRPFL